MMKSIMSLILILAAVSHAAFVSQVRNEAMTTALAMTKLNFGGKMIDAAPGSPLKDACAKAGFKPKYSCKKGDCGSCTISVGGVRIKACVGKVPPEPKLKSLQEKGLAVK